MIIAFMIAFWQDGWSGFEKSKTKLQEKLKAN